MSATRSDGVSIGEVFALFGPDDRPAPDGYARCDDPDCPQWQFQVSGRGGFFSHWHPM